MEKTFAEIKYFQVNPEKVEQFEQLIEKMKQEQGEQPGCLSIKYLKRFFTIDGVELGQPPREIKKIVKCVRYYSYWEFDNRESYGLATKWYFGSYMKELQKLLITLFDISCGYSF